MGTPFGRQNFDNWAEVRKWDEETAIALTHRVANGIRHRFPHENCTHDNCCEDCKTLIKNIVTEVRQAYESWLGNQLSEILNIKCPFPHGGSD